MARFLQRLDKKRNKQHMAAGGIMAMRWNRHEKVLLKIVPVSILDDDNNSSTMFSNDLADTEGYCLLYHSNDDITDVFPFPVFREKKMNVREIHSRKPQLYRTRVSEEFKEAKHLVIQVGVPVDREQYINRLGRTGREGTGGEGILLLADWEEYFLED
ncbi:hypothetical protein L2E82_40653 [Cichorium intybus]|uniref:Uncharacterized protein n=1 Tax=Cichorium intybus TaxID=13427 RepID=A0ACB9AMC0_CICIN|nr:hypothetical protein L2E82_40653 [Cichorium intybus]